MRLSSHLQFVRRFASLSLYVDIRLGGMTMIFVILTILHLVFQFALRKDVLVVPIAIMFTIPTLRSSMPGAPDFGELFCP
jgi:hypothetical protein